MSKTKTLPIVMAKGVGLTFLLYLSLQLLLALLTVRGIVAEGRLTAFQIGTAVLAVLPGGVYAARHAGLGTMWGALGIAGSFAALTALTGLLCFDHVSASVETWVRLVGMAAGGVLAGLLCSGKGRRRKRHARKKR